MHLFSPWMQADIYKVGSRPWVSTWSQYDLSCLMRRKYKLLNIDNNNNNNDNNNNDNNNN